MKFATVRIGSRSYAAVVEDGQAYPFPEGVTVRDVVRLGLADALHSGRRVLAGAPGISLADVTLLAPLEPATMRDFVAFEEHVEGVRRSVDGASGVVPEWYEAPTFYLPIRTPSSGPAPQSGCPAEPPVSTSSSRSPQWSDETAAT